MKDYLKMSDVFKAGVLVENSTAYTLKSELDKLYRVREVNDDTMMCSSDQVATYAAHAINSHDELVEMNNELISALKTIGVHTITDEDGDEVEVLFGNMRKIKEVIEKFEGGAV